MAQQQVSANLEKLVGDELTRVQKLEDDALVSSKFEIVAQIRRLEAQSALMNVELNRRGITNKGLACW